MHILANLGFIFVSKGFSHKLLTNTKTIMRKWDSVTTWVQKSLPSDRDNLNNQATTKMNTVSQLIVVRIHFWLPVEVLLFVHSVVLLMWHLTAFGSRVYCFECWTEVSLLKEQSRGMPSLWLSIKSRRSVAGKAALSASTLYYVTGGNTHPRTLSVSLS